MSTMIGIARLTSNIIRNRNCVLSVSGRSWFSKQVNTEDLSRNNNQDIKSYPKYCPAPIKTEIPEDKVVASSQIRHTLNKQKSQSTPPPPPSQPPKNDNDFSKYAIGAAILLAGSAGLIYFNKNSTEKEEPDKKLKEEEKKKPVKFRSPQSPESIPKHVPYLLIGGGTASFAAFRAIKSNEAKAKVLVLSDESHMPYMRPPLSKEVWFNPELGAEQQRFKQWNGVERSLFYEPEDFYISVEKLMESPNGGVAVARGYSVAKVNVDTQIATLTDGTEIKYDKCLIATGVRPKSLNVLEDVPAKIKNKIYNYKEIQNFEELKQKVEKVQSIAIVGGGFLGSELSCSLAFYGRPKNLKVFQLFHETGNMGRVLPEYLSEWTTERVRDEGVEVLTKSQIVKVEAFEADKVKLILNDGKSVVVDLVIQAVGTEPNVELVKKAGLEIDPKLGGIVVNSEMGARSNLYVAGDVACFYDPKLGRRRVEHHDHAVVSGRLAGENMVGLKKPYTHQSMFWSDLGPNVGYEAIGLVDSSLETFGVFAKRNPNEEKRGSNLDETTTSQEDKKSEETTERIQAASTPDKLESEDKDIPKDKEEEKEDFGKGVVFYMKDGQIVGILLWNVFNRINIARRILNYDKKFDDLNEVAKLFDIYEQQN